MTIAKRVLPTTPSTTKAEITTERAPYFSGDRYNPTKQETTLKDQGVEIIDPGMDLLSCFY